MKIAAGKEFNRVIQLNKLNEMGVEDVFDLLKEKSKKFS